MDSHKCQIASDSDFLVEKTSSEPFFAGFTHSQTDDEFYFNIYDQLLIDNQTQLSYSESESEEDIEESEEDIEDLDDCITRHTSEESLEVKSLISFCQNMPKLLPQVCDLIENDPVINEEMEAIEKESVHMDLLTCSAATANCYRDSSKVSIRSKYGKWSCNGRFEPEVGLGPLSHLFTDCFANQVSESQIVEHNFNQFQQNYDICGDYNNRMESSFAIKDLTDGYVDGFSHQMYYQNLNQQNQSISASNGDSQSLIDLAQNETNSGEMCDKCFDSTQSVTECQQMYSNHSNQFNHNYIYTNVFTNEGYTYDPNAIPTLYYQ